MKYFPQFFNWIGIPSIRRMVGWCVSKIWSTESETTNRQGTFRRQIQPPISNQPWLRTRTVTTNRNASQRKRINSTVNPSYQSNSNQIPTLNSVTNNITSQSSTSTVLSQAQHVSNFNLNPLIINSNTSQIVSPLNQTNVKFTNDVDKWLQSINMEMYIENFKNNDIHELSIVEKIKIEELENYLKISSFGHRKSFMAHIEYLSKKQNPQSNLVSPTPVNIVAIEMTTIYIKIGNNSIGNLFDSNLKIQSIYEFVKSSLNNPEVEFDIILPPKNLLCQDKKIKDCGLFPKASLIAKTKVGNRKFELKSEFLKKKREEESLPRKKPKIE
jgi:hypothetical protein